MDQLVDSTVEATDYKPLTIIFLPVHQHNEASCPRHAVRIWLRSPHQHHIHIREAAY